MTWSRGFARISLSGVRWLLPWLAVLLVSAALAGAMSTVVHVGAYADHQQTDSHTLGEPPSSSSPVE